MTANAWLGVLLTCIGGWFGFANPVYHLPPLALLLPAGVMVISWAAPTPKRAFKWAWAASAAVSAASVYWVSYPVYDYALPNWALAAPCSILVGLYLGLYPAIFAGIMKLVKDRLCGVMHAAFAGALWWGLESIRTVLLTGFPWNTLASAFAPVPQMLQLAAIIGAGGISALLVMSAVLFATSGGHLRPLLFGALILVGMWGYGQQTLSHPITHDGTMKIALIQGNINQAQKWDDTFRQGTIDRYRTLTEQAASQGKLDLVVWPETALPFYMQKIDSLSMQVRKIANETNTPILTGTPAYTLNHKEKAINLHNRAYLVPPSGTLSQFYDKEHLVPFGEYVPLKMIFFFVEKLVEGAGDFVPGRKQSPIVNGDAKMGVLICYEAIFPELAQSRVLAGANILINISNDAWFGKSSAPAQHLSHSVLRAIEQGRTIARCTNTGISAVISPRGEILTHGSLFRAEAIRYDSATLHSATTFFHRNYTMLQAAPYAVLIFVGIVAYLSRKRQRKLASIC